MQIGASAGSMNPAIMQQIQQQAFNNADTDASGGLNSEEFNTLVDNAQSSNSSTLSIPELFSQIDTDGNGEITETEMRDHHESTMPPLGSNGLSASTMSSLLLEQLFNDADSNSSGGLNLEEFTAMQEDMTAVGMRPPPPPSETNSTEELFSTIDSDEDGEVTVDELTAYHDSEAKSHFGNLSAGTMNGLLQFQQIDSGSLLETLLNNENRAQVA